MLEGYELNKAVVEACGIEFHDNGDYVSIFQTGCFCCFSPSSNWDEAMLLAEKSGLFDQAYVLMRGESRWKIEATGHYGEQMWTVAEHESGPVAICNAIVSLKAQVKQSAES